jgi:hypothetical protein
MSGAKHRAKGNLIEREIVNRHEEIGVHAERYPLSGATRFRGEGHDIDVYAFGVDQAPLTAEVKGRKGADGFRMLERWLGEYDLLFLRRNRSAPLVVLPWRVWARLIGGRKSWLPEPSAQPLDAIFDAREGRAVVDEPNDKGGKHVVDADDPKRRLPAAGRSKPVSPRPAPGPALSEVTADGDAPRPPRRVAARKARA